MVAKAIQEVTGQWDNVRGVVETTNQGVQVLFCDAVQRIINNFPNVDSPSIEFDDRKVNDQQLGVDVPTKHYL